jgi:hypothetical protein
MPDTLWANDYFGKDFGCDTSVLLVVTFLMFWNDSIFLGNTINGIEFCYGVYNQCESFICLDLMIKNRKILIERYFNWWTSTKLVCDGYQPY